MRIVLPADAPRSDWLEARRHGIGSSDASAIVGRNPYRGPMDVYWDKITPEPEELDTEPIYWGHRLEPIVAEEFTRRTGLALYGSPGLVAHDTVDWLLATPDRMVLTPEGDDWHSVLECKTAGFWAGREWDADSGDIGEHALWQVQHTMAVTGYTHAWVAALVAGQRWMHLRVERDDVLVAYLLEREEEFWQAVRERRPPDPDGSEASERIVRQLWDTAEPEDPVEPVDLGALEDDLARFAILRTIVKEQETEMAKVRQRIVLAMDGAERGQAEGFTVTYRRPKPSTRVDLTVLRAEYPDVAQECSVTSEGAPRFTLTEVKAGA